MISFIIRDKLNAQVVMDNGILRVTLSNPEGIVTEIQYNGIDNLLEVLNDESNRGYTSQTRSCFYKLRNLSFGSPPSNTKICFQIDVGIGTLFGAHQQVQEPVVNLMCMFIFIFSFVVLFVR